MSALHVGQLGRVKVIRTGSGGQRIAGPTLQSGTWFVFGEEARDVISLAGPPNGSYLF